MSDIDIALKELDEKLSSVSGHVDEIEKRLNFMGQTTMDPVLLLKEQVSALEQKIEFMTKYLKMQSEINNIMRFLINKKFSKEELDEALNEFETAQKMLKNDEKPKK